MSAALREVPMGGADELVLTCRPGKTGNKLTFSYTLENRGQFVLYPMHAMASIAPDGKPSANEQCLVVILAGPGSVILGKLAAPLPIDRQVAVPAVPLASRLAPGGRLEGLMEIELPLAETSPYFGDLPLRQYKMVDVDSIMFTIGYWVDNQDGLTAAPDDYAPGLFVVVTRKTLRSARYATQKFPTKALQLFKRMDAFPRNMARR